MPMTHDDMAKKYDHGKPRMELLPPTALEHVAHVLGFGARKYGDFNWRAGGGLDELRLIGAMLRHVFRHMAGERYDRESGQLHLAHAATTLLFLLDRQEIVTERDPRGNDEE